MKVNTELCIDLKTRLQHDTLLVPGREYHGILRRDIPTPESGYDADGSHFTFIETLPPAVVKPNPRVYEGPHFSITRAADGSLRINFRRLRPDADFDIHLFALDVANELREALKGLV